MKSNACISSLSPEIISQVFEFTQTVDLVSSTDRVSRLFHELSRERLQTMARNPENSRDIKQKIRMMTISDLCERGQIQLAFAKIDHFNIDKKCVSKELVKRFNAAPSFSLFLAVAAIGEAPYQALNPPPLSPKLLPSKVDFVWLSSLDSEILINLKLFVEHTLNSSDSLMAQEASALLANLDCIKEMDDLSLEILSQTSQGLLSKFACDQQLDQLTEVYEDFFSMNMDIIKLEILDALVCLTAQKIALKAPFPEYNIENYVIYACALARFFRDFKITALNAAESPSDSLNHDSLQQLLLDFSTDLNHGILANASDINRLKQHYEDGFADDYLGLDDEDIRKAFFDLDSPLSEFISVFTLPDLSQVLLQVDGVKDRYTRLKAHLFQRLTKSFMDEIHPSYGKENALLKKEGLIHHEGAFQFPHHDIYQHFRTTSEFLGGIGIDELTEKVRDRVYDFENL